MKTSLAPLLWCALLAPAALPAADSAATQPRSAPNVPPPATAQSFEGRVVFRMTAEGKSQDMRFALKNGRSRIEISNQQGMGAMIMDPAKREQIVLLDQQKMYLAMAMPDVAATTNNTGKNEETTLTKTGETEKILGYTAEKYLATHKNTTTELWLAEGLGHFTAFGAGNPMASGRGGPPTPQGWERALAHKGLFPLRVITRDAAKKELFKLEATSVEKQALPDSLFAPPADYRKLDMGGMMNGMVPPGTGR